MKKVVLTNQATLGMNEWEINIHDITLIPNSWGNEDDDDDISNNTLMYNKCTYVPKYKNKIKTLKKMSKYKAMVHLHATVWC